ncbi:hypothetical protein J3A83DRAFT_4188603 [Scleroderma citrinum]
MSVAEDGNTTRRHNTQICGYMAIPVWNLEKETIWSACEIVSQQALCQSLRMATQVEDMTHGYNSRHELMDTTEVVLGDDCQLVLEELDKQNKIGPKVHVRLFNGKGGHLAQLEKVGQAIEGLSKPPRFEVTIPAGKPVNPISPTPCHPKRRKVTSDSTKSADAFEHGCKNMSANNMDLGHIWNHKSQWSTAIPAQAPAPLPQSNQIHDKATSEPDGQNSPNQSEKLSMENMQDKEHLDQDLYDNPPPEHQEQWLAQSQHQF